MVYMLLGTGFEETEAVAPIDLLRRAGVSVATVGIGGKVIVGSHGILVTADMELGQMDLTQLDMIVLPGGIKGVASIKGCPEALEAVQFAWENGRFERVYTFDSQPGEKVNPQKLTNKKPHADSKTHIPYNFSTTAKNHSRISKGK